MANDKIVRGLFILRNSPMLFCVMLEFYSCEGVDSKKWFEPFAEVTYSWLIIISVDYIVYRKFS